MPKVYAKVLLGLALLLRSRYKMIMQTMMSDDFHPSPSIATPNPIATSDSDVLPDIVSGTRDTANELKVEVETEAPSSASMFNITESSAKRSSDASIMITSNLIPTHPNIGMLQATVYSCHRFLKDIPMDTPIYVVVDGLPEKSQKDDNEERRNQYIEAVRRGDFAPFTNIQVVPMEVHRHLAGSVKYTLENYIETEFLYIIQHDMPFMREVDHWRLLKTMRERPDVLYNVRFRYNNKAGTTKSRCLSYKNMSDFPAEDFNGLNFFSVKKWSDNNHLTTKKYYTYLLSNMKHHRRSMEAVLGWKAKWNCTYLGQQIYGRRDDNETHVCHLNGRMSATYNDANKVDKTKVEKEAIWCRDNIYGIVS